MNFRLFIILVVILTTPAWVQADTQLISAVKTASCKGTKCHVGITAHPEKEDCNACHSRISPTHPEKGKMTISTSTKMCLKCHFKVTDHDNLHSPVAAGDCKACHDPHSDRITMYLQQKGPKVICYKCHMTVTRKTDTYFHGPVKKGKCEACHTQHGSPYPHLLTDNYSTAYFNDYKEGTTYKLCFQCHKLDLLLYPKTSYNTNFRDGKTNLHYLHVNRSSRGMSCKLCHRIHSADLPKLMADKVSFGDWQMPINFKITKNGGSCSPGCHKAESYDRTITNRH